MVSKYLINVLAEMLNLIHNQELRTSLLQMNMLALMHSLLKGGGGMEQK